MFEFFSCVAAAVAAAAAMVQNVRDVIGAGKKVYDLAADIVQRWNGKAPPDQRQALLRRALAQAAQTPSEQFEKEMRKVVANTAGNQPAEAQDAIVQYLNLIPQRIQQNFARQEDPTGTTVPVTWAMQQPEDLLPLLPPRLPRFRAGESPPNAPKWVLTRRLGLGGFGEVWQAKHKLLKDRYAAFKFCFDPASQKRVIEHEMEVIDQVVKQLRHHPNIVALEEVDLNDTAPGRPRLVVVPG